MSAIRCKASFVQIWRNLLIVDSTISIYSPYTPGMQVAIHVPSDSTSTLGNTSDRGKMGSKCSSVAVESSQILKYKEAVAVTGMDVGEYF